MLNSQTPSIVNLFAQLLRMLIKKFPKVFSYALLAVVLGNIDYEIGTFTSSNTVWPKEGVYTGGQLLAQQGTLSFQPADGSYYAQIILTDGKLTVISNENKTLYESDNMRQVTVSRQQLIDQMSEMFLFSPGSGMLEGDLLESFVPEYDKMQIDICYYYAAETPDEVAYTIYWFDGVPTWFAQGVCFRFYEMISK